MKVMVPSKIAIVGAGIGGLALAKTLIHQGHQVRIFEKTHEINAVGSGLTLWPNATRVLKRLGALELCLRQSSPLRNLAVKLWTGKKIMDIPTEKFETPAIAMHRGDLHLALLTNLRKEIFHLGYSWTDIRENRDGVYLSSPDGDAGPFDLLVGADGLRSKVRSYVNDELKLSYKGYVIWRGVAEVGSLVSQDGDFSETWGRGQRFGILPIGNKRVCWYATVNVAQGILPAQNEKKLMIAALFSDFHDPIGEIIARTPEENIIQTETVDRPQPKNWSRGRVVLMGDAIHPIAANLGQGACMALEDSIVLGDCIQALEKPEEAFALFEKIRRPRVSNIQQRSSWIGNLGQWQRPWIAPLRNVAASVIPGSLFTLTSRALHSYRAEDQVARFTPFTLPRLS